MTYPELIAFLIYFFIILAIVVFPRIYLRKHATVTSEEIAKLRPDLRGIKYKYNLPLLVGFPLVFLVWLYVGSWLGKYIVHEIFFIFAILLVMGIYEGFFALITGVFPMTTRWNWNLFVFDRNERYRWLAQLQILLSVVGMFVSLALAYF